MINIKLIETYLSENKLTKVAFCKKANISVPTLNRILKGEDIKINCVLKIAKAIGVDLCEMFRVEDK